MAFEGRGRILVLEVSSRNILGMECIQGTSPLKVTNFFVTRRPSGEPREVARFLRETLEEEGITAKKTWVIFTGTSCEHRLMVLPKISREERESLVLRKLEEETQVPMSELAASHSVVGSTVDRGIEKHEVLVVSTPLFEVKRLIYTLMEAGLEPALVTSLPVVAAKLHPADEKDDYMAFLYLTRDKSHVVITLQGYPRFSREIQVDLDALKVREDFQRFQSVGEVEVEVEEADPVADRVVTELTRSFLYFKQISRGGSVKKVYLWGEYAEDSLISNIQSRLAVDAVRGDAIFSGKFDLVERAADKAASFDPLRYVHALALAKEASIKDEINLLPPEFIERKRKVIDRALYATFVVMFLAINVLLLGGIYTARKHYQGIINEVNSQLPVLYEQREYSERVRRLKDMAAESERILADLKQRFVHWEEFLGLLAASTPSAVTFDEMMIRDVGGAFEVALNGYVVGVSPKSVQDHVNRFLRSIEGIPYVARVNYKPHRILPSERYVRKYEELFRVELTLVREVVR